jgi:hypothetical protein
VGIKEDILSLVMQLDSEQIDLVLVWMLQEIVRQRPARLLSMPDCPLCDLWRRHRRD